MHVYGMQKLLEQQGKDRVVNVRSRASLYQALERLVRLGLVEVRETVRSRGLSRPDRLRDHGRRAARPPREWLREMLRTTGEEYPEFIAAVSLLFALSPDDAREQLEQRAAAARGRARRDRGRDGGRAARAAAAVPARGGVPAGPC